MNISYSRFTTYLDCPYKHFLGYIKKLTPNKPERPLQFGSDMHTLLEHRFNPEKLEEIMKEIGETYYDLPASWQSDLSAAGFDYIEALATIFDDYRKVYSEDKKPTKLEQAFEIKLGTIHGEQVNFIGIIDELYLLKKRDKRWVEFGEHKTFNYMPEMSTLTMNTQKSLYAKAIEILFNKQPRAIRWDYIRSTPASYPALLKAGGLSHANSQNITPFSWLRACDEYKVKSKSERAFASNFEQNLGHFFFRVRQDILSDMTNRIWSGFKYTAKEIVLHGEENKTRNVTKNCNWCQFKPICLAQMTGGDVKYTVKTDYKTKEEKEPWNEKETLKG